MKRPDSIYIVAGGPSLKGKSFELLRNKTTIAVNAAIVDVPNPDYFITVDYSFLHKVPNIHNILENSPATKVFVANMTHPFMKEIRGAIADTRFNLVYDLSLFDLIIKSRNVDGIGRTFGAFCSGLNSGYCALQLAILLRAQKVYLLGVDLTVQKNTHYHDWYCTRRERFVRVLGDYLKHWENGLRQIQAGTDVEVISCSPISPLNEIIPYIPYEEVLQ